MDQRECKRELLVNVVYSKVLYATPVWASALEKQTTANSLLTAQRSIAMRIASTYKTVSTSSLLVIHRLSPLDLMVKKKKEFYEAMRTRVFDQNKTEVIRNKARKKAMAEGNNWKVPDGS